MHKNIIIIFWGNPFFDGRCMNMVDDLNNQNHKVTVLGIGNKKEKIEYNSTKIILMKSEKFNNPITKYLKYFSCIKQFIKNKKPDVIIAADLYSMIPIAKTKKYHNAKIIYDSRELYTKLAGLKKKPVIQKIWSYYEKKYIKTVDSVLVTAKIDQEYLSKLYTNLKIKIIKNLPSNNFLNPKPINLKKILCIDESDNILIYQGKFHEGRGLRFVIECMEQMNNVVLVLIGDGPMKTKYIEVAEKYKVENKIFFIDAVPYQKLGQFSAGAYIGLSIIQPISKSYEHALPNKLFEYAVTGIPAICSNLTAMQEVVDNYKFGIAINPKNKKEFIEAYEKIKQQYQNYIIDQKKQEQLLWKQQKFCEIIDD